MSYIKGLMQAGEPHAARAMIAEGRKRSGLRQQVAASPLFAAERFARNFEAALWEIGRKAARR